jgi:hypothetical protein
MDQALCTFQIEQKSPIFTNILDTKRGKEKIDPNSYYINPRDPSKTIRNTRKYRNEITHPEECIFLSLNSIIDLNKDPR